MLRFYPNAGKTWVTFKNDERKNWYTFAIDRRHFIRAIRLYTVSGTTQLEMNLGLQMIFMLTTAFHENGRST